MKISDKGLDLIKSFEGCRLTAYQDSVGVWTIGWGHTKGVYKGQKITQQQADDMLRDDMGIYESKVNKYNDKYNFNQNQFDALTSFAYNVGSIDQLTANGTRTITQISSKILAYDKAGGKTLAGLTRRRKAEKELFDTPASATPASSYSEEWVNGVWYNKDGTQTYKCEGAWKQDNEGWWYEDTSGWFPKSEWVKIDNEWYYFEEDGYMASNKWIGDSWVDKDGKYDKTKKKAVKKTTTPKEYEIRVTAGALNIRKEPSTKAAIVGVLAKNETATVTEEKNGFGKIGDKKWIMLKYTAKTN